MSADRPLNDAQERALIALSEYGDRFGPEAFSRPSGVYPSTIYVLQRMGLVETREYPSTVVARVTEAGQQMLGSMGD